MQNQKNVLCTLYTIYKTITLDKYYMSIYSQNSIRSVYIYIAKDLFVIAKWPCAARLVYDFVALKA